ncbi:unnamed protein product [Peniophora sp. CBMAI 1063]|nr:unnamed protein product [Peniophora sp. CBMAI 1063]
MPLSIQGYEVHIESEGEELPQYQVEKIDDRTMTCWIPSQAGKPFAVGYARTKRHSHEHKVVDVYADGHYMAGQGGPDSAASEVRWRIAYDTKQAFLFSEVVFAPDENESTDPSPLSKDLAVIEVQILPAFRKKRSGKRAVTTSALNNGVVLSEKSKLIGANHAKLGNVEKHVRSDRDQYGYAPIGKEPCAVFRFVHRPPAILQAMGIMPRPVQPVPAPADSATIRPARRKRSGSPEYTRNKRMRMNTNDEEQDIKPMIDGEAETRRRKIQEQLAAEEAKAAALRAQLEELDASVPRIKAERAPSPIIVPHSGEVIDLTDD